MIRSHLTEARLWRGYSEVCQRTVWKRAGPKKKRAMPETENDKKKGQHKPKTKPKPKHVSNMKKAPPTKRIPKGAQYIQPEIAPPMYLTVTGSPNVYAAKCVTDLHEINPKMLFDEGEKIPPAFRKGAFEYMSPIIFNHEPPRFKIPEVAFLGRSNVGKSSLMNSVMQCNLARSSKQPGRTQTVNYYGLMPTARNSPKGPSAAFGFLIDLPGYGFAKAPDENVDKWQQVTQDFLLSRRDLGTLQTIYMLVDARRGPSQIDRDIMGWFDEAEMSYTTVLTKCDRVPLCDVVKHANTSCMRFHSQFYKAESMKGNGSGGQEALVHVTSATKNRGIVELMCGIDAIFTSYYNPGDDIEDSDVEQGSITSDHFQDNDDYESDFEDLSHDDEFGEEAEEIADIDEEGITRGIIKEGPPDPIKL